MCICPTCGQWTKPPDVHNIRHDERSKRNPWRVHFKFRGQRYHQSLPTLEAAQIWRDEMMRTLRAA